MADTIDHRVEGKSKTPRQKAIKLKRDKNIAAGLCATCGKVFVENRVTCYSCTNKVNNAAKRSLIRKTLETYGLTKELIDEEPGNVLHRLTELIEHNKLQR